MPSYVESARHVVECHGAHACDENTLESSLELLENVAVKALGVGYRPIHLLASFVEHGIGEVVIFVYNEVEGIALGFRLILDNRELTACVLRRIDALLDRVRIMLIIVTDEAIQLHTQIKVELFLQFVYVAPNHREVEEQHLVPATRGRWMFADPEVAKPLVKLVLRTAVIIRMEHAQEDALAETPGTDEDDVPRLLLQFRDVHGLVHIV